MKTIKQLSLLLALLVVTFTSCEKETTEPTPAAPPASKVAYIVNYGSYSGAKSEISIYNVDSSSISHNAYEVANSVEFASNIESMSIHDGKAYFMSNNGDKIDIVDAKTLVASVNPISTDIIKPRHFAATGNTAYISCWGGDDWGVLANSYIAKIDLTTNSLTKIAVPGGPEGVIIKDNKLFAALSTTNKVVVIDLATEAITYITVSAVPQQFVEDGNGKIWVSLVSKYSTPFPADSLGLAVINPTNQTIENKVSFSGMGGNGFIHISKDKETIYALGNEAWPGTASTINTVNVSTKTLNSAALISGEKFNGFNVNPDNDNIFVLISPSSSENGTLKIFNNTGTILDEETTGIGPKHVVFHNL